MIPGPDAQVVITNHENVPFTRADFAYPDRKIAIYIDGIKYHTGKIADNDREITNTLQLLGWKVLRFDYKQITNDPYSVIKTLKLALSL